MISDELQRIIDAKSDIKTAIEAKGVTVGDVLIDAYAEKIDAIIEGEAEEPFPEIDDYTYITIVATVVTGLNYNLYLNKTATAVLNIDWGDGSVIDVITGGAGTVQPTHTYADYGTYTIKINSVDNVGTYTLGGSSQLPVGSSIGNLSNSVLSIIMGATVTSLYLRSGTSVKLVILNDSITSLGNFSFQHCYSLERIRMSPNIVTIAGYSFNNCYTLQEIDLPVGVTSINVNLFENAYSLKKIVIPANVTSIGGSAFYNCCSLRTLYIPAGVTSIGNSAFFNCYAMEKYIFLSTTPPTLGTTVFSGIYSRTRIYVPDASVTAYKTATNWVAYANYIYPLSQMTAE